MLVFGERGEARVSGERKSGVENQKQRKPLEGAEQRRSSELGVEQGTKSREPTNPAHLWCQVMKSNMTDNMVEGQCYFHCAWVCYIIAAMLVDENKKFLISSFCSSTSNNYCTLQHCYLCPQRLVANHLYTNNFANKFCSCLFSICTCQPIHLRNFPWF